jgi:hypothetical protein
MSSPPRSSTRIRCSRFVAAQHDQRNVGIDPCGESLAGADRVDELERLAVDVNQDQVRRRRAQQCERLGAVGCGQHAVAVGGQVVGQERARGVVFLGQQDGRSGR